MQASTRAQPYITYNIHQTNEITVAEVGISKRWGGGGVRGWIVKLSCMFL